MRLWSDRPGAQACGIDTVQIRLRIRTDYKTVVASPSWIHLMKH